MATLEAKAPAAPTPSTPTSSSKSVPKGRSILIGPGSTKRKPLYIPVKNEPGVLLDIDKNQLYIDHDYQRKLSEKLVTRIAANWSWISCGVISVSQRPGVIDKFFVFDGQHRWKAATLLPNVTMLPCVCFELDTVKDEAIGFLATNTDRKMPTLRDQFKALIMSGDPAAILLDQLAQTCGRTIGSPSSATTISSVSDAIRCIRDNDSVMVRVFPLLAALCKGEPMTGRMIRGMHYLEGHMPKGQSLNDLYWTRRILKIGLDKLTASMWETVQFEGQAGNANCANGILRALNKNLRNPISMVGGNGK